MEHIKNKKKSLTLIPSLGQQGKNNPVYNTIHFLTFLTIVKFKHLK